MSVRPVTGGGRAVAAALRAARAVGADRDTIDHFTAWNAASCSSVGQTYSRMTSTRAANFLNTLRTRCPFPVRASRSPVDCGVPWRLRAGLPGVRHRAVRGAVKTATAAWRRRAGQRHPARQVLRLPLLTHRLRELRPLIRGWEQIPHCMRPHQFLRHRIPTQYLHDLGYEIPDIRLDIPGSQID